MIIKRLVLFAAVVSALTVVAILSISFCSHDAHDKVQLWEGGVYWATKNIGADKPEDYGYYFYWGDTVGYKREGDKWDESNRSESSFSFSEDNTLTYGKSISELERDGWIENKNGTYVLASKHDAAQAHLKGAWRMPTEEELDNLNKKCNWTWDTRNGVNGYVIRGKGSYASNSIFLPCAGYGNGDLLEGFSSYGSYWSSVPYPYSDHACGLYFNSNYQYMGNYGCRSRRSIRPVQGFPK